MLDVESLMSFYTGTDFYHHLAVVAVNQTKSNLCWSSLDLGHSAAKLVSKPNLVYLSVFLHWWLFELRNSCCHQHSSQTSYYLSAYVSSRLLLSTSFAIPNAFILVRCSCVPFHSKHLHAQVLSLESFKLVSSFVLSVAIFLV